MKIQHHLRKLKCHNKMKFYLKRFIYKELHERKRNRFLLQMRSHKLIGLDNVDARFFIVKCLVQVLAGLITSIYCISTQN